MADSPASSQATVMLHRPLFTPPTKLHPMRPTKSALLSVAVVLSVSTMTACTPSPTPDETLQVLYQDALHDAEALTGLSPAVSTLRTEHADEIAEEIRRLCGFTDEGALPESCELEVPAVAAAPATDADHWIADSQVRILNQLGGLPEESIPLITEHYIEQARLSPVIDSIDAPDGAIILEDEDLAAAQEHLAEEYAAAWALGVALAHVDPAHRVATQTAIDRHREYAALLRTVIEPFAETSPSEPGYDLLNLTDPVDGPTALTMITEVQNHAVDTWHSTASQATDDGWRSLATQLAGATAKDTVPFS